MKVVSPIIANRWLLESRNECRLTYFETHGEYLSPAVLALVVLTRERLRGVTVYVTGGWRDFIVRDGQVAPVKK